MTPVAIDIQRESIDAPLRNKLWSAIQLVLFDVSPDALRRDGIFFDLLKQRTWLFFFKRAVDTVPRQPEGFRVEIRNWFFDAEWYEVYDFIEFIAAELENTPQTTFGRLVNGFLEQEVAAYRLIEEQIAEITSEEEVAAIQDALTATEPVAEVRQHIRDALAKATDRKAPDYRNSIKESISAVEAVCQAITGNRKATLGDAIKRIKDSGIPLHPSLEQAWTKLYGYTSDEGGIRHALSGEPRLTFADAKYMLVTCSAFVNYLLQLAAQAGLKLDS